MSKVKKVFAIILSMAMILGMSLTTFATTTTYTDNIRVYGVEEEEGITVTAYQIIRYDEKGEYVPVVEDSITVTEGKLTPMASDVLELSQELNQLTTHVELQKVEDYYTSENALAIGTWMVIVTGSDDYIYNPAIVSVNQTADGIKYGELNLDTDTWGANVWLKKTEPTITKTAITPNVSGVQYGDIIQFQIETEIPSYTPNKTGIVYTISDTLDGLALVVDEEHPVEAKLGGVEDSTLTGFVEAAFENNATSVKVEITGDSYIRNNGNKKIVITYYAKVTESAKLNVNEITNDAELEYSTGTGTSTKADKTKHYTFGIDTTFTGTIGTTNTTGEFIKIDENGTVEYNESGELVVSEDAALDGAVFELHFGGATGGKFVDAAGNDEFTTDENGRLEIVGLDSEVDYYLVETKAPQGYTINNEAVKVRINATYDNNGDLTSYSVVIGEGNTQATTDYNYSAQTGTTTIVPGTSNPYGFKNSVLSTLPSTGGIGTTIFTVGGCAIMIAAAGLFFASRRKESR